MTMRGADAAAEKPMRSGRINSSPAMRHCRIACPGDAIRSPRWTVPVSRWAPNARERLETAALDLFVENGYEKTTVAQIADRAGLNRATFFRHFAEKREVLFGGEDVLAGLFAAPCGLPPRMRRSPSACRRGRRGRDDPAAAG